MYKQSDAMNALAGEFKRMIDEQKKLLDPNRKEDSDESDNSDDDLNH